ncbi:MAG: amino acid-binding protein [Bacteroidaceae bacterium]|nr:amino acid-binding protein [Bacteroidaceae bacterium]
MTIKQLSIFIENKGGTLIKVLDLLSKAGIQIIASTVADTKDYGIYRVLTNNPAQAYLILKDAGINVQLSEVFALSINDQPGRAAETIKEISDAGVSILYLYSFLWKGKGVLVFRADQSEKAKESIMLNKLTFLTKEDFRA